MDVLEGRYYPVPAGPLDIDRIGSLGLVGNFDGLSIRSEPADTPLASVPSSSGAATLVRRAGANLEILGQTSPNGTIDAICIMPRSDDGALEAGVDVFVGGRFSTIGGVRANNIARYDPIERQFFSLARGLDGPVRSLLCDKRRQILYVGGRFRAPVPARTPDDDPEADPFAGWGQFGGGIAKWQGKQWRALPFKGVGHVAPAADDRHGVNALALSADGRSVIVGGGFSGTADSPAYLAPNSQPINLGAALVSAGATSTRGGQDSPQNIVCTADGRAPSDEHAWLMQDNAPGYWRAQLPMPATVSLLKIKNAQAADRGVKTFSVTSLPDNGLLTLSYFDAELGRTLVCRERCPLQKSAQYQYFHVAAENQREGRGINLNVIEWYGSGGGLSSIELFQRDVLTYADNRFNFPACAKTSVRSAASLTGAWSAVQLPSLPRTVMQHTYTGTAAGSITFRPHVPEDGFYEIYLLQPGCDLDQSCDRRNLIDVTVTAAPQAAGITTTVDQSVRGNRRVLLYTGLVASSAGDGGFSPHITLSLARNARALGAGVTGSIVADAVQFVRLQTISQLNGVLLVSNTGDTGITWNGLNDPLPSGAIVHALQPTSSGALFIGGQFRDNARNYTNIVEYASNATLQPLPDTGVNGVVHALADTGDTLWIGGGFTHSARNASVLLNLAPFSYRTRQWQTDVKVDGPVTLLDGDATRRQLFVAGAFQSVFAGDVRRANSVSYAIFNVTDRHWEPSVLARSNGNQSVIDASASYTDLDGIAVSYLGGSSRLTALEAVQTSGALAVNPRVEAMMASNEPMPTTAAISGVFYKTANGSTAMATADRRRRIAIWEQGRWQSLTTTLDVASIEVLNRTMFIGGTDGIALYTLEGSGRAQSPTPLKDGPDGAIRRFIRKSEQSMIVGGSFNTRQQSACRNVCQFNAKDQSWHALGDGISEAVVDMAMLPSKQDVVVATDQRTISIYDDDDHAWRALGDADDLLPGPITSITLDGSAERVIIAGRASDGDAHYLVRWVEDRYEPFGEGLEMDRSIIRQLAMVPITRAMSDSRELSPNFALLVVGRLYIAGLNGHNGQQTSPSPSPSPSPLDAALFDEDDQSLTAAIARVFFEIPPLPMGPRFLAVPLVILIAAAISLALIALIVLLGLLIMMLRRRMQLKKEPLPPTAREVTASIHPDEHQSFADGVAMLPGTTSTPPYGRSLTDLHHHMMPAADGDSHLPPPASSSLPGSVPASIHGGNDGSIMLPADMTGALTSAVLADDLMLDTANYMVVYARYPFSATEPGELEFRAGDKIYVLDNSDDIWWMGMVDNGPGVPPSQGVFPASYASETAPDPSPWNFF
ncbi:cortical protein marker for cell polarity-domain-containing protein [Syncephalis pseudoplumigaleata]|uniref:Cortical protein marker for cell polarity-domain-containing protein n=1 Tax=Syncephalis pseudoplumigaleata TaxID=1712513 RepID=A0A4P9Z2V9_9FUNG|nr:cortical protein marker for cell polarity-domain-containing protein [Syncephalis pseudoplumigaleata]|eukprot:RKP26877.1 cortical protein marker for cell polarity-domain-containing protein [Syncephalis pseudoplumigaleata]